MKAAGKGGQTNLPASVGDGIKAVLNALGETATRSGDNWSAKCPAHEDNKASLSVGVGKDGRVLVKCHAGCDTTKVMAALGLPMSSLYSQGARRIVATYEYKDESGNLLYESVRYEPKDFRQRQPGPDGQYIWNLKDARYVLYRLPELIAAVKAGQVIYIVEGEKDVDNLRSLGQAATCNPMGAGKWSKVAGVAAEVLRGAQVVIIADADKPGHKHGREVAESLKQVAAEVKLLTLPGAKDFSEWKDKGGTLEQFAQLIAAASAAGDAMEDEPHSLLSITAGALLSLALPPREYLLNPWLRTKDTGMVHAWRGLGKTFCAMSIAGAVASGGKFLEWQAPKPRKVLYIDGELPAETLQERLRSVAVACDFPDCYRENLTFITPDLIGDAAMPNLVTTEGQKMIDAHLTGVDLVVMDNISTLCRSGAENEAESWQPVQDYVLALRRRGIATLLVHHSGKGGKQRGTSKREDVLDFTISLERPKNYSPDQGARFIVQFEKARGLYGKDVVPFELRLAEVNCLPTWQKRDLETAREDHMRELAAQGLTMYEIAKECGCHKSTVSRTLSKNVVEKKKRKF